ncbi:hypothetical protein N1851_007277 [Merluccius polli]|uniref:Uncharacterized protein n=1 Tax=Merluccius polli TaxID=89951 RepID=A0AA47N392_MERPO|nr:hypothetical protein N1851_007277 [Merluccius polli]
MDITMKLRICMASTPVIIPHTAPPSRPQSQCLMVASMALPKISHVTQSWKDFQSIPRLNPLHPPLVSKRTVCLETLAVHHHNQQRSLCMQRKEHYTYHQGWRRPFYGTGTFGIVFHRTPAIRFPYTANNTASIQHRLCNTAFSLTFYGIILQCLLVGKKKTESAVLSPCRTEIREQLKRQIEEKRVGLRLQLARRAKESDYVREEDRLAVTRDREKCIQHSRAMTLYRDENKKLMEQTWRDRALTRSLGALEERKLLRLNPINWSGTLK